MAKSSRASSRKANNQRLKTKVFGPVELARNERLSAKLLELAAAPKPERSDEGNMDIVDRDEETNTTKDSAVAADDSESSSPTLRGKQFIVEMLIVTPRIAAMDIDASKNGTTSSKSSSKKNRITKRRKTSKIVFPKYGEKSHKKRKH